jgi:hypothetical protein
VTTSSDGPEYGGFAGEDGDARFLLDGAVLTVQLRPRLIGNALVRLVCTEGGLGHERILGYRTIVAPAGTRTLTADLEGEAEATAAVCLVEGTGPNSGDIVAAGF